MKSATKLRRNFSQSRRNPTQIMRNLTLALFGGVLYYLFEIFLRGYSHWTMFLLGGLCFVLVGGINEFFSWGTPLVLQMLLGALLITALELITGCVVNLWLGWGVWDYSGEWGNVLGQICPKFSALWFLVAGIVVVLDDFLRWRWYGEEFKEYRII